MAQRIDVASNSNSQHNLNYDDTETTRLANNIKACAKSLSIDVAKMKDDLRSFVSVLEEVQVTVSTVQVTMNAEPSLVEKIMGWLKSFIKAIAGILATFCRCTGISAPLPSAEPNRQTPASTLKKGVASIHTANSGAFLEHIILLEVIDSLIQNRKKGRCLRTSIP
jgi:hypothetical protein